LNSAQYPEEIKISNVPKMKSVFIVSVALRMLETLTVEKCDELKQIIIDTGDHNSIGGNNFGNVFPKLKRLYVEKCVQLEYIFGLKEWSQLASGDFIKVSLFPLSLLFVRLINNFHLSRRMPFPLKNVTLRK